MKTDETYNSNPAKDNTGTTRSDAAIKENEERNRKEGVRKGALIASIIGIVILILAGIIFYSRYNRDHKELLNMMENQRVSLTDKITERDSSISNWINTFDEVEKNLVLIKEKEKVISNNSSNAEVSKDKKQKVLEDIKYINSLLEENKKKIASLNSQLKKSGGSIKAMQVKIAELEASMKQSENDITDLKASLVTKNFEITQLNTQVTGMQNTIVEKDTKITNQTYDMNKAFYVVGPYKELKAKGLLTKEGGFIGLGRKEALVNSFSDSAFVQIDRTVTKTISVNSKNAKLITDHPADSYEFVRDNNKNIVSLDIKDPAQFWKISKYAVIETSK